MARKRDFFEGLSYSPTKINPDDIIYRKGIDRPSDEEIIKKAEKEEIEHNRVTIYVAGTIILAGLTKFFGINLPLLLLFGGGAVLGVSLFLLERKIKKNKSDNSDIKIT